MFTVGAANSGKPFLQIATFEKGCHRLLDDRPPVAILDLKAFIVDLVEGVKVLVDQTPQIGGLRITWTAERRQLEAGLSHAQHATPDSRSEIAKQTADPWQLDQ